MVPLITERNSWHTIAVFIRNREQTNQRTCRQILFKGY